MPAPFISFLTDFGAEATSPAVCRGVMWGVAPDARILDLTHAVTPFSIREGAFLLWTAIPYLPAGVHVAVVDPGVGTPRRPIALRTGRGDLMVGPDNGLLRPAAERAGGIAEARVAENRGLWLPETSSTFHGRDIFAPVGAHLAAGTPLQDVGPLVDEADLVPLSLPEARIAAGWLQTAVLFIDRFGNCRVAGDEPDLVRAVGELTSGRLLVVRAGDQRIEAEWRATFGMVPPNAPLLYRDADTAGLALAVNQGSASAAFSLSVDDPLQIEAP